MYAIIEDSGQQFKVSSGDVIQVDNRDLDDDAKELTFEKVLLVSDGDDVTVGTPLVEGASVVAEIIDPESKGEKIDVIKYKRRKGYRRHKGHRQQYVEVRIGDIKK